LRPQRTAATTPFSGMERLRSRAMSAGAPTIPPHQARRRTLLRRAGIASGDCGLGGHRRPLARFYPAQACSWSSPEVGVVYATPLHWRPIGGIGANPELWVGSKAPKSKGTDVGEPAGPHRHGERRRTGVRPGTLAAPDHRVVEACQRWWRHASQAARSHTGRGLGGIQVTRTSARIFTPSRPMAPAARRSIQLLPRT
jgi:hypothetical protein